MVVTTDSPEKKKIYYTYDNYHNIIALDCHKIIEELIGSAATV
jgi:hypothetical protein